MPGNSSGRGGACRLRVGGMVGLRYRKSSRVTGHFDADDGGGGDDASYSSGGSENRFHSYHAISAVVIHFG